VTVDTDAQHVTVRMYNVGFGDGFLVVFPGPERPRTVLIDLGTHSSGQGPKPVSVVAEQVIRDVTGMDGVPRIDVVVATHRHQDHVSGFQARSWDSVEVGEVWMPWTEDPNDVQATKVRERQSSAARHLCFALERLGEDAAPGALELARNSLKNARAMDTLHAGFAGSPVRRFLPTEDRIERIRTSRLPGVRVHVLGPSRDPDVIRDMDPPAGESYLRLLGASEDDGTAKPPFPASWEIEPDVLLADEEHYGHLRLTDREFDLLRDIAGEDTLALAVSLEKAVNGTSLMLAFEVGDALLLFPGDAQWGTWRRVLDDVEGRELLQRTTFLKVGHHGSHNATPKDFVEVLKERDASELWAMVSTRAVMRWPFIPKRELLEALGGIATRLARSDDAARAREAGFRHADTDYVEARVPIG
jgi:beta-lactamase superfamily II metal-dependent hydrolase